MSKNILIFVMSNLSNINCASGYWGGDAYVLN